MQYQAPSQPHQVPEQQQWIMPPWLKQTIDYVNNQLNWLDLAFFGLGVLILLILLLILLKRRKRVHTETVDQYEQDIEAIKNKQLDEIAKAERRIEAFKEKLDMLEGEFQKDLKKQEKEYHEKLKATKTEHSKKVRRMEKGYFEIHSADEHSMFELKQEINRLRTKQMTEVETFQDEIKNLRGKIKTMHEGHSKKIEQSEMEISDLRKQLQALMYRI